LIVIKKKKKKKKKNKKKKKSDQKKRKKKKIHKKKKKKNGIVEFNSGVILQQLPVKFAYRLGASFFSTCGMDRLEF